MTIEMKVNQLAEQVIPADRLESFKALDLNSKLIGIAIFAAIGGDTKMQTAVETARRATEQ